MILIRVGRVATRALRRKGICSNGFGSGRTSPSSSPSGVVSRPRYRQYPVPLISRTIFTSGGGSNGNGDTDEDPHALFKEQMEMLKQEREELFGFTEEEQSAWGNVGKQDQLPSSLMESVERARADAAQQQQTLHQVDPNFVSSDDDTTTITAAMHRRSIIINNNNNNNDDNESSNDYQPSHGMTHLTEDGNSVHMVDVGTKTITKRIAKAETRMILPTEVLEALLLSNQDDNPKQEQQQASTELVGPKGPIFATAKIAGIMAAKKTSDLIPLCHPLPLDKVQIDISFDDQQSNVIVISCECRVTHKTGVEMEALTGASVAALAIYDMLKALSHNIRIEQTILVSKSGGKRTVG